MAVVISNGDTTIGTVNGFYRCESSNLHFSSVGHVTATTTPQHLSVTFANAGNIKGIGLGITSLSAGINRGMRINLAENVGNPTISIASPAVITKVAHGLNDLDEVFFDTTGTLPTGITRKTVRYYVRNKTADTFNISTTPTGSLVNTSGSQSGTHTIWAAKVSQFYTWDQILTRTVNNDSAYVGLIVPFEFSSTYAVDTNANKWRFIFWQEGGTSGSYAFMVSDGVISENFSHFAWCDNAVSFTNNDVLIVKDIVTIDASFSIRGVLGTGNTVYSTAGIICRSLDTTEPGIYKLRWEQSPSASYTMTIDGGLQLSSHAGFKIGDEANVIPLSNKAIVNFEAPSVGTDPSCIRQVFYTSTARPQGKHAISFFGEIPTHRYGILASNANTSQNKIVLTEDLSSEWNVGDQLFIGKAPVYGQTSDRATVYTISSFNGTEITLSANLTVQRIAGATVINASRSYGVELSRTLASGSAYIYSAGWIHHKVSGCKYVNVYETGGLYSTTQATGNSNMTKEYLCDNLGYFRSDGSPSIFALPVISNQGAEIKRNLSYRMVVVALVGAIYTTTFKSGLLDFQDNRTLQCYTIYTASATSTNFKSVFINNVWENNLYGLYIVGLNTQVTGNIFWGGSSSTGAVQLGTFCSSPRFLNNTFDRCFSAFAYRTGSFVIDGQSLNDSFGQEAVNNVSFGLVAGVLCDFAIVSPTGTINFSNIALLPETLNGFKLRIVDENDVANVDRMLLTEGYYVRCGDGLADTTVHTAGTGKFSLRLEPLNEALKWEQYVPTGNIQNKTMSVLAWCKINSSNYWSGSYVMPKLVVEYDGGTIAYVSATQTTDWQLLSLPITPTTTTGRIKVTLQIESEMSGSDAYVYFDDMAILYPAGHQIDLGGLDLWSGAEPITPTIATNVSAADIWNFPTLGLTATGTTGKKLKDGFTVADSQALL